MPCLDLIHSTRNLHFMHSEDLNLPNPGEGDTNHSINRDKWNESQLSESSRAIVRRDSDVFFHQSVSTPCLTEVVDADGIYIKDADGKTYIDFHGNSVHHLGYKHPRIVEAIRSQMDGLTFAPRRFACKEAVEFAELLTSQTPGDLNRLLLAPSGADAMEMALCYARAVTKRHKTISFWDSYHGAGFGGRSIGGESMFRSGPIGPLLPGNQLVPPFGDYRNAWGVTSGSAELCANTIRYVLSKEQDVAAVIAEPTRAVPYIPPPGFWQSVKKACEEFGALLIFDEIPTGLGKTGKLFASEWEKVVPDIMVLGKSLGGAMLPIAAMVGREDLNTLSDFAYGHYTHEKNPILARVGKETIQTILDEDLVDSAQSIGKHLSNRLNLLKDKYECIGDVRGRGCLFGVELVKSRETREPDSLKADQVLYACLKSGLSFKISMGNVLTLSPPLITSSHQLDQALDILDGALNSVS